MKVRHVQDAEDIFQNVCLAITENWHRYDPERPFRAWAFGIVSNKVRQHFREGGRHPELCMDQDLMDKLVAHPQWDDDLVEEKAAMQGCIRRLTQKVRILLRLRYHERMSMKEIGGQVGWTPGAVAVALTRARHALKGCVKRALSLQMGS